MKPRGDDSFKDSATMTVLEIPWLLTRIFRTQGSCCRGPWGPRSSCWRGDQRQRYFGTLAGNNTPNKLKAEHSLQIIMEKYILITAMIMTGWSTTLFAVGQSLHLPSWRSFLVQLYPIQSWSLSYPSSSSSPKCLCFHLLCLLRPASHISDLPLKLIFSEASSHTPLIRVTC